MADTASNHTAVIARMQRDYKLLQDSYKELEQDRTKAAKEYNESLDKERASLLSKFEADKSRQVNDEVRVFSAKINQLEIEKEDAARDGEAKLANAKLKFQAEIKDMEQRHELALGEEISAKERTLLDMASQHRHALKRLELEHSTKISEMEEEHSSARADSERKSRLESTRLERRMAMLLEEHNQALAEKDTALVVATSETERKLASQAAEFAKEMECMLATTKQQALEAEEEFRARVESLNEGPRFREGVDEC